MGIRDLRLRARLPETARAAGLRLPPDVRVVEARADVPASLYGDDSGTWWTFRSAVHPEGDAPEVVAAIEEGRSATDPLNGVDALTEGLSAQGRRFVACAWRQDGVLFVLHAVETASGCVSRLGRIERWGG